jgi:hypothetical protein
VNITPLTATIAAALLLGSTPALASTNQSQQGPIHIDAAELYPGTWDSDDGIFFAGSLQVAFTNGNSTPATQVVFALQSSGYVVDRFDDVGSFAKGVSIKHGIPNVNGKNIDQIAVAKATFADGTVWTNPAVAPPVAPPAKVGVDVIKLY